jgi:hypothetical protein
VMLVGPRAAGKTTTARRLAADVLRLDEPAVAADPDTALRRAAKPVFLDKWQEVPRVLGALKRSVESTSWPGPTCSGPPCATSGNASAGPARCRPGAGPVRRSRADPPGRRSRMSFPPVLWISGSRDCGFLVVRAAYFWYWRLWKIGSVSEWLTDSTDRGWPIPMWRVCCRSCPR